MQPALDLAQTVLQTSTHGVGAELQPFAEQQFQRLDLWACVQSDQIDVDPETLLHVGGGEQVPHQFVDVDAVRARDQHDADRLGVIALVAQILEHRQFLGSHLIGDLLDDLGRRHLVRQRGDDHIAVLAGVDAAHAHRTIAGFVHADQIGTRGDDLGHRRVVRAAHVFAQIGRGGVRIVQQPDAGAQHFTQVVRRNVGGHADGNASGAVEQHMRHPRGQP